MIETLQAYGWSIIASIASSRKLSDKSALLFRQSQPRQMPVFCLSLNDTDKLRLINVPEDITKVKKSEKQRVKLVLQWNQMFFWAPLSDTVNQLLLTPPHPHPHPPINYTWLHTWLQYCNARLMLRGIFLESLYSINSNFTNMSCKALFCISCLCVMKTS